MKPNSKVPRFILAAAVVLGSLAYRIYDSNGPLHPMEYITMFIVFLLGGSILYLAIDHYKNERAGLKAEDEFSNRVKERAAARAFMLSVLMWVVLVLFVSDLVDHIKLLMEVGIVGMGIIFFGTWFYLSRVGISSENED